MLSLLAVLAGWLWLSVVEPDPLAPWQGGAMPPSLPEPPPDSPAPPKEPEALRPHDRAAPAVTTDVQAAAYLSLALACLVLGGLVLLRQPGPQQALIPLPELEVSKPVQAVETAVPTPEPTPTVAPEPPAPPPPPSEAPIERLRIGSIGIDAGVVTLGVDASGVMQSPSQPMDIGWYDFSAHPGFPGNAVFAGHVDFARFGPAVFWKLRQLTPGDEVEVALQDGTSYRYVVVSATSYAANSAPVEEIIGPTERESVTLITCDGTFNTLTREYDQRLVVRAERLP